MISISDSFPTYNTNKSMEKPIIALAPMDWITNNAYRAVCQKVWDNPKNEFKDSYDFYRFTEFMSVEWYVRNPSKLSRHLLTTQNSALTIAQIYGGDHNNLLQTAIDIDKKYSDSFYGIELNIGCPSPKIMACEAGSGMLKCRPKTLQIIKKISKAIEKPFSIKTRRGLTEEDTEEQFEFIMNAAPYCHMITIHGRTYKQSHNGNVDWDYIIRVKKELSKRGLGHIKVIWNGGLKSAKDWLWYIGSDGVDGVMLGQAAMCNPWSLVSYAPEIEEIYELCVYHFHLNLANEYYFQNESSFNEKSNTLIQPTTQQLEDIAKKIEDGNIVKEKWFSLIEFRKHLFRYVNGIAGCNEFKRSVATIWDYPTLIASIHSFFQQSLSWK